MAEFGTYSFKAESATFGVVIINGFADGDDVVTIAQVEDTFSSVGGAKGDVTRVQSSNDIVEITIKLLQSSQAAKDLINIHTADKETGNGVFPFVVTNSATGEVYTVPKAWITRMPNRVRGQGHNAWEFTLHGNKLIPVTG